MATTTTMPLTAQQHEQCGRALFNFVWTLLEKPQRTEDEDDMMVHACHASFLHWSKVGEPVNFARGEWQLSRVYAVLGRPQPALHHAQRCLKICQDHGIGDFDLAYTYEALARAHAVAGRADQVKRYGRLAGEAGRRIAADGDRKHFFEDLGTVPGYRSQ